MTEAQAAMAEHEKKVERVAEYYVGKLHVEHGSGIADPWLKQKWYIERIFNLGVTFGRFRDAARRCRSTTSPIYKKYDRIALEVEQVKDHLALELLDVIRSLECTKTSTKNKELSSKKKSKS